VAVRARASVRQCTQSGGICHPDGLQGLLARIGDRGASTSTVHVFLSGFGQLRGADAHT
jgi:hypothetical protein